MAIREQHTRMASKQGNYKRAVGVFKRQEDVEHVIRSLKDADYTMNRVSVLARNVNDIEGGGEFAEKHGNEAPEGAGIGAITGTVLGGVTGFLIGVSVLAIPGVGPVLAAGAEISALASTLAGAGAGALTGGIVGALVGLGIPEERARVYENRIKAGDYLVLVSGTDDELRRVESIMGDRRVEEFEIFEAPRERHVETHESVEHHRAEGVHAGKRPTHRQGEVTKTYDIDRDDEPEVVVVDKRDHPR